MARVKLDECLSPAVAELFAAKGHDVATVPAQGWGGLTDEELWPLVSGEKRVFVTIDLDFSDVRKYPPQSHAGIVVMRAEVESRTQYEALAQQLMMAVDLDSVPGALIVVSPSGVRIRNA